MTLAHYDALTARAFDGLDAAFDHGQQSEVAQDNEQVSRIATAVGRIILHLGVPSIGVLALWLNT
jgi:hypothetical protein